MGKFDEEKLPHITLEPREFRKRCERLGWDDKTIYLMLVKPYCRQFVKVGDEMLKVAP
jgi:hypothetical protein